MDKVSKSFVNLAVDRQEVDQFGFIDLNESFEKGIISGSTESSDSSFNGVNAPGLLLPRSLDVFESIRQSNYVQSVLRSKASASSEREKLAKEVAEKSPVSASS